MGPMWWAAIDRSWGKDMSFICTNKTGISIRSASAIRSATRETSKSSGMFSTPNWKASTVLKSPLEVYKKKNGSP